MNGWHLQLQAKQYLPPGATVSKEVQWHCHWKLAAPFLSSCFFVTRRTTNLTMRRCSFFCPPRGRTMSLRVESHARWNLQPDTCCNHRIPLSSIFGALSCTLLEWKYGSSGGHECSARDDVMAIYKREQQHRSKTRFIGAVSTENTAVQLHWKFFFFQATFMPAKRKRDTDEEINDPGAREWELQLRKHRMLLKRAVDYYNELPGQLVRHCRSLGYDMENMPETPDQEVTPKSRAWQAQESRLQMLRKKSHRAVALQASLSENQARHHGRPVGDDAPRRVAV